MCVPAGLSENRHVQCTNVTCYCCTQYTVSAGSQWFYLRLSVCDREREREGLREENKINTRSTLPKHIPKVYLAQNIYSCKTSEVIRSLSKKINIVFYKAVFIGIITT